MWGLVCQSLVERCLVSPGEARVLVSCLRESRHAANTLDFFANRFNACAKLQSDQQFISINHFR